MTGSSRSFPGAPDVRMGFATHAPLRAQRRGLRGVLLRLSEAVLFS